MTKSKLENTDQESKIQQENKRLNDEKDNGNKKLALQKHETAPIPVSGEPTATEIEPEISAESPESKVGEDETHTLDKKSDAHLSNSSPWPRNILAIYLKKYPAVNEEDIVKNNHLLSFPTKETGEEFFDEISKDSNTTFFATWVVDGKTQDDHLFSCGTGQVFKGSFAKIHEELMTASNKLPKNSSNRTKLEKSINDISVLMKKQKTTCLKDAMSTLRETEKLSSEKLEENSSDEETFSQSSTSSSLSR